MDMQDSRRATIYPTVNGWFVELQENGWDGPEVRTYGPVDSAFEAHWYLRTIANPESVVVSREIREAAACSPSGHPVTAIRQVNGQPQFGEDPSRFITHADLFYTFVYDSLCDLGYEIDGDHITAIRPGFFWDPQTEVITKFLARPATEAHWKALSQSTAARLLKDGRTYTPVRIDGLSFRPALPERLQAWAD